MGIKSPVQVAVTLAILAVSTGRLPLLSEKQGKHRSYCWKSLRRRGGKSDLGMAILWLKLPNFLYQGI